MYNKREETMQNRKRQQELLGFLVRYFGTRRSKVQILSPWPFT